MTRLALVHIASEAVLEVFEAARAHVDLPTGDRVSPPAAGWTGGGDLSYRQTLCDAETGRPIEGDPAEGQATVTREIAVTGPAAYVIAPIKDAKIPASKRATGPAAFSFDPASETVAEAFPTETVPIGEVRADLVARVKAEAGGRIVAIAPEWKQRNLTAQAVILAEKGRANWTTGERAAWEAGEALWTRIAAIRAASDAIEQAIAEATGHGAAQAAYDNAEWPE